jgi:hypothetical protein
MSERDLHSEHPHAPARWGTAGGPVVQPVWAEIAQRSPQTVPAGKAVGLKLLGVSRARRLDPKRYSVLDPEADEVID